MTLSQEVLKKFGIDGTTSVNKAIQLVREHLDSQSDPLHAANVILKKFGVTPLTNTRKAYIFAMTSVEQSMITDTPNIEVIIQKANSRVKAITNMLGPYAFNSAEQEPVEVYAKKGNKRNIAKQIYIDNKDKGDKYVIELVQKELSISKQNAYTYVYLVKKDLQQQ
jgi:hypothetical protein